MIVIENKGIFIIFILGYLYLVFNNLLQSYLH